MRLAYATASWLLLFGLAGCAPIFGSTREPAHQGNGAASGIHVRDAVLLYQDTAGALSYRADARVAGPGRPVSGGYIKAVAVAGASAAAPGSHLVNVRADLQTTVILGLWRRQCVEVNALAFETPRPPPAAP